MLDHCPICNKFVDCIEDCIDNDNYHFFYRKLYKGDANFSVGINNYPTIYTAYLSFDNEPVIKLSKEGKHYSYYDVEHLTLSKDNVLKAFDIVNRYIKLIAFD
jgi:hypothetical protein